MKPRPTMALFDKLKSKYYEAFKTAKQTEGKQNRAAAVDALEEKVKAELIPDPAAAGAIQASAFGNAWHKLEERVVRDLILSGKRADGRDSKTLRDIECLIDVLPRVHGSAVFQRGETQALVTVTAGHQPRRATRRRPVRGILQEVHARLLLPAVLGRRSASRFAARAAAKSATGRWPNAA